MQVQGWLQAIPGQGERIPLRLSNTTVVPLGLLWSVPPNDCSRLSGMGQWSSISVLPPAPDSPTHSRTLPPPPMPSSSFPHAPFIPHPVHLCKSTYVSVKVLYGTFATKLGYLKRLVLPQRHLWIAPNSLPPPVSCLALFRTSVLKFYLYYFFIVVMFIILNLDFKNGYELPYVSSTWERKDRLQSSAGT